MKTKEQMGRLDNACAAHPPEFERLQREAAADGRRCVVGAVVINAVGEAFLQRRAPHVRHFPGCWDIVGGHVEPGETLCAALAREVHEETGWLLTSVEAVVHVFDWIGRDGEGKREIDVLATVAGDLARPRIENDRFTEARWLGPAALRGLADGPDAGDTGMIKLALRALTLHDNRT